MEKIVHKAFDFYNNRKSEFFLLIGICMAVFGTFSTMVFPYILRLGLDWNFKLEEGKFIYDKWRELPLPILTKVYLFDIQNPEQFESGAIPQVKEIGPYVYKSADHRKVRFMETATFHFEESLSVGPLTDTLTLVNVPLLMIFSIINNAVEKFPMTPIVSPIVNNVVKTLQDFHDESFIERRTVGEVLNGRRIPLLDTIDIIAKPLRMLGLPIPEYGVSSYKLRDNKYGFLAMRNDTFGPFEAWTGVDGTEVKLSRIASYRGKRRLGVYRDKTCDAINGTDGMMFGTFPDSSQPIYIFNSHACRSLRFDYVGMSLATKAIGYRYEMRADTFDGPQYNKDNWCFCPKGVERRKCHGLLDMGQCLEGVPFALTFPHFLHSPRFMSGVHGLNPDPEKHNSFFEIEKTLGITLKGLARFQINLKLRPFSFVPGLNNFRQTLLPYLWFEEGAAVEGSLGLLIRAGSWSISAAHYGFILTTLLGTGVAFMSSANLYKKRKQRNQSKQMDRQRIVTSYSEAECKRPPSPRHSNKSQAEDSRPLDYDPPVRSGRLVVGEREELQSSRHAANHFYPDVSQTNEMDNHINTIAKTVDMGVQNGSAYVKKISLDSQRSVIDERHSGHSIKNQLFLPPIDGDDGTTRTTLIIQRRPFPIQTQPHSPNQFQNQFLNQ